MAACLGWIPTASKICKLMSFASYSGCHVLERGMKVAGMIFTHSGYIVVINIVHIHVRVHNQCRIYSLHWKGNKRPLSDLQIKSEV